MTSIKDKATFILKHEEIFADSLALCVVDKPQLNVWMILVPIIFVYFFYRYQRFSSGRKAFAENYMIGRKRAINEALLAVGSDKDPDADAMARLSNLPDGAHQKYAALLSILMDHYIDLLSSDGNDFNALIRSVYKRRANYLLFMNRLNQAEKVLNVALKPHLSATTENVDEIINVIETNSEKLRRETAERIFP